jgi:lipopolysaccharide export system protein LptC
MNSLQATSRFLIPWEDTRLASKIKCLLMEPTGNKKKFHFSVHLNFRQESSLTEVRRPRMVVHGNDNPTVFIASIWKARCLLEAF